MATLSSKQASRTKRVIVYGPPKCGKTLITGQLAEYYDLVWFDLENGHETLFQLPLEQQEKIELIAIPDTRSYPMAIETCLKVVKQPCHICDLHGKDNCPVCRQKDGDFVDVDLPAMGPDKIAVFDSLTQLTNSAIANITKGKPDDYKLDYDDWGNLGKLLDIFLSHIQQAGYNVIVTSHENEIEGKDKKTKIVPVGGTRNFSRNVAKYFDHVVYMERKNMKHLAYSSTTHSNTILTGSRTSARIEDADNPSLLPIFRPDLYPPAELPSNRVTPTTNKGVKSSAASTLARLRNTAGQK